MAETFKFELVSPEKLLVSTDATEVVLPGSEGEMTIMAKHAPVMTSIKPGVVSVTTGQGATDRYVVFGGFVDVLPQTCTLLAESAVSVADIDRDDLARRIKNAREDVDDAKDDERRNMANERLAHLTTLESGLASV